MSAFVDFRGSPITPGHKENNVAGRENRVESIPANQSFGIPLQPQPLGGLMWRGLLDPIGWPLAVDQSNSGGITRLRLVQALFLLRGVAVRRFGVPRHLADPQAIVLKDFKSAFLLHNVVAGVCAPAHERLFVTPTG